VFYQKVKDIYVTSIDYDPNAEATQAFFKIVQNKLLWAVSHKTAAEIIHARADAQKPNMGLTSWAGAKPRKSDVAIAKNYLFLAGDASPWIWKALGVRLNLTPASSVGTTHPGRAAPLNSSPTFSKKVCFSRRISVPLRLQNLFVHHQKAFFQC
jgi:hypothetical protein